jgi:hypothetical protein
MMCSVMMNMICNTCFGSAICYIANFISKFSLNCHFELFEENCMKIITTGQIFLLNYKLLKFSKKPFFGSLKFRINQVVV